MKSIFFPFWMFFTILNIILIKSFFYGFNDLFKTVLEWVTV